MKAGSRFCCDCLHKRKARMFPREISDLFKWCGRADDACITERLGGGKCGREGAFWTPKPTLLTRFRRLFGVAA